MPSNFAARWDGRKGNRGSFDSLRYATVAQDDSVYETEILDFAKIVKR
jgi:hypothetical protein